MRSRSRSRTRSSCGEGGGDDAERDPFTLSPLGDDATVILLERGSSPTKTLARVNAAILIDYMLTTGDFSDPETRTPFSEDTLARIDAVCVRLGKPSVLRARTERAKTYADAKFLRDALCGLERMAGDGVSKMYDAVDAVNHHREASEDATVRLLMSVVPEVESAFVQMWRADAEFTRVSRAQLEAFLRGPPQRRTPDPHGFLRVVVEMFRGASEMPPDVRARVHAAAAVASSASVSSSSAASTS